MSSGNNTFARTCSVAVEFLGADAPRTSSAILSFLVSVYEGNTKSEVPQETHQGGGAVDS
jgi:hypothetical protein